MRGVLALDQGEVDGGGRGARAAFPASEAGPEPPGSVGFLVAVDVHGVGAGVGVPVIAQGVGILPISAPVLILGAVIIGVVPELVGDAFVPVVDVVGVVGVEVVEVEEDLVVGDGVLADLLVAEVEVAALAGAVSVSGHVDEGDAGVVELELGHGAQVVVRHIGCRQVAELAAPGPHQDVDLGVVGTAAGGGDDGPQVVVGTLDPFDIAGVVGQFTGAIVLGTLEEVQVGAAVVAIMIVLENIRGERETLAAAVGKSHQPRHAGSDLAAVGGVTVGNVEVCLGGHDPGLGDGSDVSGVVVDDEGLGAG